MWKLRYKYYVQKRHFKQYVSRKWELLRTPKEQRPVKKLLWLKMDEAKQNMVDELGRKLYGGKEFDGLDNILGDK